MLLMLQLVVVEIVSEGGEGREGGSDYYYILYSLTACSAGSARLVGGSSAAEGRVEVCSAGRYWTICGEGWDNEDAAVICRQLRYSSKYI